MCPDYTLTLWNDGKVYWKTKIVAGAPGTHATPMISAEMKFITVNPTWNVPPSIIEKEYLPALEQDPNALERIGLKVEQAPDGTVRVYQPPGAGNALGRIRFNFPNKFLVYQHDTPDKYLFAKEKRAYSHGCMRVQNPLTYGEKLLSLTLPRDHYTEAKLESMFGGNEININFPKPLWVHLTYQTAFVDADGKLQFRDDVYGRDAKMIAILKGSERKVADIPVERSAGYVGQAGAHAGRHVRRRQQLRQQRRLLRLPVRRGARRSFGTTDLSARTGRRAHGQQRTLLFPLESTWIANENAGETIAGVFALGGNSFDHDCKLATGLPVIS